MVHQEPYTSNFASSSSPIKRHEPLVTAYTKHNISGYNNGGADYVDVMLSKIMMREAKMPTIQSIKWKGQGRLLTVLQWFN